jgi:hypothetical protein
LAQKGKATWADGTIAKLVILSGEYMGTLSWPYPGKAMANMARSV